MGNQPEVSARGLAMPLDTVHARKLCKAGPALGTMQSFFLLS